MNLYHAVAAAVLSRRIRKAIATQHALECYLDCMMPMPGESTYGEVARDAATWRMKVQSLVARRATHEERNTGDANLSPQEMTLFG